VHAGGSFGVDVPQAHAGTLINAPKYLGLHQGLVGFWNFDGPSVSGVHAYDMSGNGNRGTLTGPTRTIGKLGQALQFDGVNDYVDLEPLPIGRIVWR
jgi:hypothetical protein